MNYSIKGVSVPLPTVVLVGVFLVGATWSASHYFASGFVQKAEYQREMQEVRGILKGLEREMQQGREHMNSVISPLAQSVESNTAALNLLAEKMNDQYTLSMRYIEYQAEQILLLKQGRIEAAEALVNPRELFESSYREGN